MKCNVYQWSKCASLGLVADPMWPGSCVANPLCERSIQWQLDLAWEALTGESPVWSRGPEEGQPDLDPIAMTVGDDVMAEKAEVASLSDDDLRVVLKCV